MLAKYWKRIGLIIIIIACLINITVKLFKLEPFKEAIEDVKVYLSSSQENEK